MAAVDGNDGCLTRRTGRASGADVTGDCAARGCYAAHLCPSANHATHGLRDMYVELILAHVDDGVA